MPAASSARPPGSRWGCSPCCRRSPTRPACRSSRPAASPMVAASPPPCMLGAAAVQIGTAYLHSPESLITGRPPGRAGDRQRPSETAFTNLFSGGLARGLPTRLTDELGPVRAEAPPFPLRDRRFDSDRAGGRGPRRDRLPADVVGPGGAARPRPAGARTHRAARPRRAGAARPKGVIASPCWKSSAVPVLSDNYVWLVHESGIGRDDRDRSRGRGSGPDRGGKARLAHQPDLEHPLASRPHRRQCRDQGGDRLLRSPVRRPKRRGSRPSTRRSARAIVSSLGPIVAEVLEVPAHTAGHIAYHLHREGVIFVGDTLFAMGCGRLFEGSADQMYANLQRLAGLPDDTTVYCAHEYTLSNGRFALTVRARQPCAGRAHGDGRGGARGGGGDGADDDRARARDQSLHARRQCRGICETKGCKRRLQGVKGDIRGLRRRSIVPRSGNRFLANNDATTRTPALNGWRPR